MNLSESTIKDGLKNGEEYAYKHIYDYHYDVLCHIASWFVKDDYIAESIVEDVIFSIWKSRKEIEIQQSLRSYLMRAVKNRCINYLTSNKKNCEIPLDELIQLEDKIDNSEGPIGNLIEKELEMEVGRAIERLPLECRIVFKKSRFENKKYEEIAEELNISVNTVKYHIKRALALLTVDLKKYLVLLAFFLEKI